MRARSGSNTCLNRIESTGLNFERSESDEDQENVKDEAARRSGQRLWMNALVPLGEAERRT